LATGAGAESRQQIGWVIVGGMSLGTLLTIFVVPTMYTLLARKKAPGAIKTAIQDAHAPAAPHGAAPVLAPAAAVVASLAPVLSQAEVLVK
jgi:multidrug efflux pump